MTAQDAPTLEQQRRDVLERLHAQRQQIAERLAPAPGSPPAYPRSVIMRLVVSRPELVLTVLAFLVNRFMRRRPPRP